MLEGLRALRRRAVIRLGKNLRRHLDRFLVAASRVGDPVIFDPRLFPFIAEVQPDWKLIRRELDGLLAHRDRLPLLQDISPDHGRISADEKWKVFFLHGYGERLERARARCPETSRLLDRVPELENAFFSILAPGQHAKRHRGVTKAFVTWHIGLIVPESSERCALKLDDEIFTWAEGESLVFDDTRYHEVWNRTDRERAVLLINFRRPMRPMGRLLADLFLGAMKRTRYITDARANHAAWEAGFESTAMRDCAGQPEGSGLRTPASGR